MRSLDGNKGCFFIPYLTQEEMWNSKNWYAKCKEYDWHEYLYYLAGVLQKSVLIFFFFVCLFIFVYCVKEVWNVNVFCEIMNSCLKLIFLAFLMRSLFFRFFSPCRVDKRWSFIVRICLGGLNMTQDSTSWVLITMEQKHRCYIPSCSPPNVSRVNNTFLPHFPKQELWL